MIDPMATGTVKRPSADPRKTATWAWSKAETERRRRAAATQPTLAPIDAFPDENSTADDLAAAGLDADPDATGPHSQTIRGLLGGACAGWRARPTSVELYDALRADNPTSRQRSIATVLINEASFEELVNAHTEGAFTWRQLARAAQRQGSDSTNTAKHPRIHWGFCQDAPGTPTIPPTRDRRPPPGAVVTEGRAGRAGHARTERPPLRHQPPSRTTPLG